LTQEAFAFRFLSCVTGIKVPLPQGCDMFGAMMGMNAMEPAPTFFPFPLLYGRKEVGGKGSLFLSFFFSLWMFGGTCTDVVLTTLPRLVGDLGSPSFFVPGIVPELLPRFSPSFFFF